VSSLVPSSSSECGSRGGAVQRILLLARVFPPRVGGIESYVYNLYSRLAVDFDVAVITPDWPGSREFDAQQAFKVIRLPLSQQIGERHRLVLLAMLLLSIRTMQSHRPSQIHCDQIDAAIVGRVLSLFGGVPYIVYAYGMEITEQSHVQAKKWAAHGAAAVIAISRFAKAQVLRHWEVEPGRVHVVHPGVDIHKFHPTIDPTRVRKKYALVGKRVILTVGRLPAGQRTKGHDSVIRCLSSVLEQIPEVVYVIAGDGPARGRLEALARNHRVQGHVVFTGHVSDAELAELYAACDLFVMPSREETSPHRGTLTEGFGLVFLEASASAKPVLGTRTGGIPDAVQHGVTGLLVDPSDEEQLCRAIVTVLTDQRLARRLGDAGRKRVENQLQWDSARQRLLPIIQELAGQSA
jgi:phosphatidylinositol alpha-1,6-mannosyltransferase